MIEDICDQIINIQKENRHITPTVNDIYDALLMHFPRLRSSNIKIYQCIREVIIMFIKPILEKRMTLKESVVNILIGIEKCERDM